MWISFKLNIYLKPFFWSPFLAALNANGNTQVLVAIVAHFRRIHLAHLMAQTKPSPMAKESRPQALDPNAFGHLNGLKIFSYI